MDREITGAPERVVVLDTGELDAVLALGVTPVGAVRTDVSDTLPGERVRARLTDANKKSFWRAETVEVLAAEPERQPHIWAAAAIDRDPDDRAGGAEFGHIELGHQRELKRQVLTDALHRMAGIDSDVTVEAVPVAADA